MARQEAHPLPRPTSYLDKKHRLALRTVSEKTTARSKAPERAFPAQLLLNEDARAEAVEANRSLPPLTAYRKQRSRDM